MALPPKTKPIAKAKAPKGLLPAKGKRGRRLHVRADLAAGGSLHVRQMSDAEHIVCLEGLAVSLADDAAKPVWIQLAKSGTFRGHSAGPFELNEAVFAEIIANFKATENKQIPIDFEHASESEATAGSIPTEGAPAQGWIVDLKIQGGNLWGLVEWGDTARGYIKTKKYKFFSPAIRFGARDRVTGKPIGARMTSGGLTNNPFLDGMMPLAAKDGAPNTPCGDLSATLDAPATTMRLAFAPAEYMPRLRYILGCSDLSTAAECADQLERLRQHFDAVGQDPDASHEGIPLGRFVLPLRSMVAMNMGHTWDDVFDCVAEMIAAASGDTEDEVDEPTETLSDDESAASMTEKTTGGAPAPSLETQMADTNATNEITMKLGAVTAERDGLTAKLKDAEKQVDLSATEIAKLTLKVTEESTRANAADAELVTLRDWKTKREDADLTARVEEAFLTWKDKKGLTEPSKKTMLIVLKADPAAFEADYPKVEADKQHLLRNHTDTREKTIPTTSDDTGGVVIDMAQAARTLSAQRGIPLGDAQRLVYRTAHAPAAKPTR